MNLDGWVVIFAPGVQPEKFDVANGTFTAYPMDRPRLCEMLDRIRIALSMGQVEGRIDRSLRWEFVDLGKPRHCRSSGSS